MYFISWCIPRRLRTFHGVTTFGRRSGVWQLGLKKWRKCDSNQKNEQQQCSWGISIVSLSRLRSPTVWQEYRHLQSTCETGFVSTVFWTGQHCRQLPAVERWAWIISSMVFFVLDQTILRHWQLGGVRYAIMQCLHIVTSAGMWQIIKISYAWILICLLFHIIGGICMVPYSNPKTWIKETQFSSRFLNVSSPGDTPTNRFCIQHIKTNISNREALL